MVTGTWSTAGTLVPGIKGMRPFYHYRVPGHHIGFRSHGSSLASGQAHLPYRPSRLLAYACALHSAGAAGTHRILAVHISGYSLVTGLPTHPLHLFLVLQLSQYALQDHLRSVQRPEMVVCRSEELAGYPPSCTKQAHGTHIHGRQRNERHWRNLLRFLVCNTGTKALSQT